MTDSFPNDKRASLFPPVIVLVVIFCLFCLEATLLYIMRCFGYQLELNKIRSERSLRRQSRRQQRRLSRRGYYTTNSTVASPVRRSRITPRRSRRSRVSNGSGRQRQDSPAGSHHQNALPSSTIETSELSDFSSLVHSEAGSQAPLVLPGSCRSSRDKAKLGSRRSKGLFAQSHGGAPSMTANSADARNILHLSPSNSTGDQIMERIRKSIEDQKRQTGERKRRKNSQRSGKGRPRSLESPANGPTSQTLLPTFPPQAPCPQYPGPSSFPSIKGASAYEQSSSESSSSAAQQVMAQPQSASMQLQPWQPPSLPAPPPPSPPSSGSPQFPRYLPPGIIVIHQQTDDPPEEEDSLFADTTPLSINAQIPSRQSGGPIGLQNPPVGPSSQQNLNRDSQSHLQQQSTQQQQPPWLLDGQVNQPPSSGRPTVSYGQQQGPFLSKFQTPLGYQEGLQGSPSSGEVSQSMKDESIGFSSQPSNSKSQ